MGPYLTRARIVKTRLGFASANLVAYREGIRCEAPSYVGAETVGELIGRRVAINEEGAILRNWLGEVPKNDGEL